MGLIPDTSSSSSGLVVEPRKWNSISSIDSAKTITPEDMYPRITPRYPDEEDETSSVSSSSEYEESILTTRAPSSPSPEPTIPGLEPLTWRVLQFKKSQEKGTIFQSELYDVENDKKPCYRISYELTMDDKLKSRRQRSLLLEEAETAKSSHTSLGSLDPISTFIFTMSAKKPSRICLTSHISPTLRIRL
ncbi:hypothetical protein CPB85DRAFT_406485 [Mucidula mucida]|nr:hypothetical protein CPB85DRAFT_406485 [Mucidula mucida]